MINKINVEICSQKDELNSLIGGLDLTLFSHGIFSSVDLKNELNSKTETLAEMGRISAKLRSLCLFGVRTDNYGLISQSVVACYGGRLLGISDANCSMSEGKCVASGYKIYNANGIKFGILAERDICFDGSVKTLANMDCDVIIDICRDFNEFKPEILIQTLSFLNGVSICFLCGETLYATTASGELVHAENVGGSVFSLNTSRRYIEYKMKTRSY